MGKSFKQIETEFKALWTKLPRIASVMAQTEFKENFRRQGYRGDSGSVVKWEKRRKPFTPSQIRRDKGRAILINTGRLRRSIQIQPMPGVARVVSDVPYAQIHNEGGKLKGKAHTLSTNRVTGKTRFRRGSSPAQMPARPFMVSTKPLLDDIEQMVFKQIDKIFK